MKNKREPVRFSPLTSDDPKGRYRVQGFAGIDRWEGRYSTLDVALTIARLRYVITAGSRWYVFDDSLPSRKRTVFAL